MPALNFKKQFAPLIASGKKTQTIRLIRKHPIKKGDKLYLYTGLRTKHSQKIKEANCISVEPINIGCHTITLANKVLSHSEQLLLAHADGFNNLADFRAFFEKAYSLPFDGVVIKWKEL